MWEVSTSIIERCTTSLRGLDDVSTELQVQSQRDRKKCISRSKGVTKMVVVKEKSGIVD